MNLKNKDSKELLEFFTSDPIKLIRVFPYESRVVNFICQWPDKELKVFLQKIISYLRKRYLVYNKVVIQMQIGVQVVFVSYWDNYVAIGSAIIPSFGDILELRIGTFGHETIYHPKELLEQK